MSSYGRDALWDAATWAELDEVVAEEVKRVSVARKVFRTEDLRTTSGAAPYWISGAEIQTTRDGMMLGAGHGLPFIEVSVPLRLTTAQVEAEETLHTTRTLARAAAKNVALAGDHIIFRGWMARPGNFGVKLRNASRRQGLADMNRGPKLDLAFAPAVPTDPDDRVTALVNAVADGLSGLGSAGWTQPYALVLDARLYSDASFRSHGDFEHTLADRLGHKLRHCVMCGALDPETGLLVSLAGDTTTVYTAGTPSIAYVGEVLDHDGAFHHFRVFEQMQFVARDPSCIRFIT